MKVSTQTDLVEYAGFLHFPSWKADAYLSSFLDLDFEALCKHTGATLLGGAFDLDKTVVDHHAEHISDEYLEKFAEIGGHIDKFCLLTNINDDPKRLERASRFRDSIEDASGAETLLVPSRVVGCRKPRRALFMHASLLLRLFPRNIFMVGDQGAKDILGANRAGYGAAVQVAPLGEHIGDWRTHYGQRPLEAATRLFMRGVPFHHADFGRDTV